jgi:histone H2A
MAPRKSRNFKLYIHRVLKSIHPKLGISSKTMDSLNDIIRDLESRICQQAIQLCLKNSSKTLKARDIQGSIYLLLPGQLARHAVSEGTKAITKYSTTESGSVSSPKTISKRSGLQFPAGSTVRHLKSCFGGRVQPAAGVYLAAVLEYITAEIVELAGNATRDHNRVRISNRHIGLGIMQDEELYKLLGGSVVPGSGVVPNIQSILLPKAK